MSSLFELRDFRRMVDGLKIRDALAFAKFCDWFEDFLWRFVQWELLGHKLTWIDPADICQEVLLGFWELCPRLTLNEVPEIRRYLAKMARTKVLDMLRYWRAERRSAKRTERGWLDEHDLIGNELDPQEAVLLRELFARVGKVLSRSQQQICQWRCENMSWSEIAERLGCSINAAQKQQQRAYDLVADDLHRDDSAYLPRQPR